MYRRTLNGQVLDFGTTGMLRRSNLVMYDRQTESWWQEFGGEAIVGELTGHKLELIPMNLVSWTEFKSAFPEGKVLSRLEGSGRPYGRNPYVSHDTSRVAFNGLPVSERLVGLTSGDKSLAVTYTILEEEEIISFAFEGQDLGIFFKKGTTSALESEFVSEGRDVGAVGVFDPNLDGSKLTFVIEGAEIMDENTGSTWNLLGIATSGPLEGSRLTPIVHHAGQLWFSWVNFKPDTLIYPDLG